jgi:DNA polymerase III delta subunit
LYYLITGEDTYRSRQKLKTLTCDLAKNGEILRFDASIDADLGGTLEEWLAGRNLFGIQPLLVVTYPISGKPENNEWFYANCENLARSKTKIIFWDTCALRETQTIKNSRKKHQSKIHKNIGAFVKHAAEIFEFSPLINSVLQKYIHDMARGKQITLTSADIRALAEAFDGNLWAVEHELEKYALTGSFEYKKRIAVSEKLYDFMDTLMVGDISRAFQLLESVRQSGFEDPYIVATLAGTLRTMLKVKAVLPSNPDYRRLAEFGMHEFVLKKTLSHIRRFRLEDLKRLYELVADTDGALKTGEGEPLNLYAKLIAAFAT